MLKNRLFFSIILTISVSFFGFIINCMQAPAQTGQLMQLPRDLHIKIMLHIADGEKPASRLVSPEMRAKFINEMRRLACACKELYALFMDSDDFNKRLSTLLSHYPSKSGTDLVEKNVIAICFANRWSERHRRKSPFLYEDMTQLSDEEYKHRSKLIENRIQKLVQAGVDINGEMSEVGYLGRGCCRILIEAVRELDKKLLRFLLAIGANINVQGTAGLTAVSELVKRSVYPNLCYEKRYSFAQITQMIEILVAAGADIDIPDKDGKTALYYAIAYCVPEVAKFLIEKGARHSDLPVIQGCDARYDKQVTKTMPLDYILMRHERDLRRSCQLAEQWLELWALMQKNQ